MTIDYEKLKAKKKKELFTKAKKVIKNNENIVFMEDVAIKCNVGKSTFYSYFPDGSDELDKLKALITANKVNKRLELRTKWADSDNATLNIALYKLIATDEERDLLADRVKQESANTNVNFNAENKTEFEELMNYVNNWSGFRQSEAKRNS